MKKLHILPAAVLAAIGLTRFIDAAAAAPPAEVEKQVEYARCIRANGYPEFPDPAPDGRMQLKLDPKNGAKFEAAQRACKDKLPAGLAAMDQNVTPERLQVLLGFAACVRGKGVKGFPDPSPKGVFEVGGGLDLNTPQAQQAVQACMQSNPPGGLMIRRTLAP
jgi:hypothetical protein